MSPLLFWLLGVHAGGCIVFLCMDILSRRHAPGETADWHPGRSILHALAWPLQLLHWMASDD